MTYPPECWSKIYTRVALHYCGQHHIFSCSGQLSHVFTRTVPIFPEKIRGLRYVCIISIMNINPLFDKLPPMPVVKIQVSIRFHLNYKTPPGVIKYRERHTPESTPAFFEVTSPKGAMLLLCLSVLDHSVEVFTNFAGHTFACSILQLKLWGGRATKTANMAKLCTSSARTHTSDSALESSWWVELISELFSEMPVSWGAV